MEADARADARRELTAALGWSPAPFEGVEVVTVGGLAAAYAGWLLTCLGARVRGVDLDDAARYSGVEDPEFRASVDLALRRLDEPPQRIGRLADADLGGADVVLADLASFEPGARDAIRADLDALAVPTRCVIEAGNLSPLGRDAPWSELTALARSSFLALGGRPEHMPVTANGHLASAAAGGHAAVAIAADVVGRRLRRDRPPTRVEVAADDCMLAALENSLQFWQMEGVQRDRKGASTAAGEGTYRCGDGSIYLALGLGEFAWSRFLDWSRSLGDASDFEDERWLDLAYRRSDPGRERFRKSFERLATAFTRDELVDSGQALKVPVAAVNELDEVLGHPQLLYRGSLLEAGDGARCLTGPFRVLRSLPRVQAAVPLTDDAPIERPLEGVRVLDFTWVGAGPFTTRILADLGADIVKVESSLRLDPLRKAPPFQGGEPGVDRSGYFANRNAGKRSTALNLKDERAVELALAMAERADVVVNSFSPGVMDRFGLGAATVHDRNPRAIYADMPLQGASGPQASHLGFGAMINAAGGFHALSRDSDGEACGTGTNFPDHVPNPIHSALALIAALGIREERDALSIEVSQFESGIAFLAPELTHASRGFDVGARDASLDVAVPRGVYRCKGDDAWAAIEAVGPEQWQALTATLGSPALDPSWDLAQRRAHRSDLDSALAAYCATRPPAEVERALTGAGVPAAAVNRAGEIAALRSLWESGTLTELDSPGFGRILYSCLPFTLNGRRPAPEAGAPALGAHTHELLTAWGKLSDGTVDELDSEGVLA